MTTTNFVLCTCPKKAEHFCKNWDGKGNAAGRMEALRSECGYNPDDCEFLVATKKREGADWLYQTIAGTLQAKTAVAALGKEPARKKKSTTETTLEETEKVRIVSHHTCSDCGEPATHKIEGYRITYLCEDCADHAKTAGFPVKKLEEIANA